VVTTDKARRPNTHPAHQPEVSVTSRIPRRPATLGQNNPVWPRGSRQELPRCGEEAALLDAQSPVVLMLVGQHTISLCPPLRACLWTSENLTRHPRALSHVLIKRSTETAPATSAPQRDRATGQPANHQDGNSQNTHICAPANRISQYDRHTALWLSSLVLPADRSRTR
jgi:hypothetical protein